MNKHSLIFTNVLITVFKIVLGLYIFSLLIMMAIIIPSNVSNKLHFLTTVIIGFFPFIIILYLFIAAFYFFMSYYERIEIFGKDSDFVGKPTKIWDLQQNILIESQISQEKHFPIIKMLFIVPQRKKGKKISTSTALPLHIYNNSDFIRRFFNIRKFTIPESLESYDLVSIPYGGLSSKTSNVPGDLYLQVKFLTRKQIFLMTLLQILTVTIPLILFLVFLFH